MFRSAPSGIINYSINFYYFYYKFWGLELIKNIFIHVFIVLSVYRSGLIIKRKFFEIPEVNTAPLWLIAAFSLFVSSQFDLADIADILPLINADKGDLSAVLGLLLGYLLIHAVSQGKGRPVDKISIVGCIYITSLLAVSYIETLLDTILNNGNLTTDPLIEELVFSISLYLYLHFNVQIDFKRKVDMPRKTLAEKLWG